MRWNKTKLALITLLGISLVATSSAYAHSGKETGLHNAYQNVKNEKAKAAIQKNMKNKKGKHQKHTKHHKHKKPQQPTLTAEQIVVADKKLLAIGFTGNDKTNHVTLPLTLPTKGKNGSTIKWVSSQPTVISNDGKIVNRPASNQNDVVVTLIATITMNNFSDVQTFQMTVKKHQSDASIVAADKSALAITYIQGDSSSSVTSPLTLPIKGANGSTIKWISSAPSIVSNDGKTVVRPSASTGNVNVVLNAIITYQSFSDVKTFNIVVKATLTDAERVNADKAALQIGFASGNTAASVTTNLTLPTKGANGSNVIWTSDQQSIISNSGKVVRPAAGTGDNSVTLTAIIFYNGVVETKNFTVIVKQLS